MTRWFVATVVIVLVATVLVATGTMFTGMFVGGINLLEILSTTKHEGK